MTKFSTEMSSDYMWALSCCDSFHQDTIHKSNQLLILFNIPKWEKTYSCFAKMRRIFSDCCVITK
uniref:Uncharacterized protein n=1 Tax=Rhizophora mucronata TaxID=61149 RepID=A0A2P2KIY9_RHIMU